MESPTDQYRHIPLFSELTTSELQLVLASSCKQKHPKGITLFYEGDPGNDLLVILSGRVKVVLLGQQGQEFILDLLGPGNFFGEMAILESAPRSATVCTLESSTFLRLDQHSFSALLQQHPSLALKMMKALCSRLREADEQLRSLVMDDIYGRIIHNIRRLEKSHGKQFEQHLVIYNRPSIQELAHMIGCSRETVSRAMRILQERGYLTLKKKEVILHKTSSPL